MAWCDLQEPQSYNRGELNSSNNVKELVLTGPTATTSRDKACPRGTCDPTTAAIQAPPPSTTPEEGLPVCLSL